MELRDWLAVGTLFAAVVMPLAVTRWQVRSMRQIALFQKDFAVAVTPPESWLWGWMKDHWLLFAGVLPLLGLISEVWMRSSEPVSRWVVLKVVMYAANLILLVVLGAILRVRDELDSVVSELNKLIRAEKPIGARR